MTILPWSVRFPNFASTKASMTAFVDASLSGQT